MKAFGGDDLLGGGLAPCAPSSHVGLSPGGGHISWGPLPCWYLYQALFLFLYQLLDYVMTTLLFSDKNVNSNLITWNRVVLLHGKLCRLLFDQISGMKFSLYLYLRPSARSYRSLFSEGATAVLECPLSVKQIQLMTLGTFFVCLFVFVFLITQTHNCGDNLKFFAK